MTPRILPFAAYLVFLALAQGIPWMAERVPSLVPWKLHADLWLYPVKTVAVAGLLIHFWPKYHELKGRVFHDHRDGWGAVGVGLIVYLAWVHMDWPWAIQGNEETSGYDPFRAGDHIGAGLAVVRIFGASVVVPIMEELFWRSFLLRYLISPQFDSVPLGTLTSFSFLATVVLFGLEHDLWLAGMMAGAAYTLVLHQTGRLWPCIVAHAVTNFALGIHVLVTHEWKWW
ncbi:MAG TPA: CAAX prenyl protease-related protein [Nitrospiraceae bacterium]|nr:CAAX prenyl protease-related protein [Nitrospiraceae bacterium]